MDFNEVYRDIKHLAIVNEVSRLLVSQPLGIIMIISTFFQVGYQKYRDFDV